MSRWSWKTRKNDKLLCCLLYTSEIRDRDAELLVDYKNGKGETGVLLGVNAVSYTHLDVYKRQIENLGQPEELIPLIKPYYLVLLASLVFVMLFNGFKQFTDCLLYTSRCV